MTAAGLVENGFDARRSATSRTYRYRLAGALGADPVRARLRPAVAAPDRPRGPRRLRPALPGSHDFTAFTPTHTDHVRFERNVFSAQWRRAGDILSFHITADAFMRNMVRILVGTMLEVASHRRSVASFTDLLKGAPRSEAGDTAPPHGLYLESVSYD